MLKKKPQKSSGEKAAESHFVVDRDDLKNATEKAVKRQTPREDILKNTTEKRVRQIIPQKTDTVEKKYKKTPRKKREEIEQITVLKKKGARKGYPTRNTGAKKSAKSKVKVKEYAPPKVKLKKDGYELVITEKPQAALKIANALGKAVQKNHNKVPYYEVDRNGEKIVVGSAVGHLFTLKQNNSGTTVPNFDISWVPNYLARKKDFTKRYYDTLLKLAKGAGSITIATDYDVEGEVIGRNVMQYICNQKDAKRMKFSTLTTDELNNSYDNKMKSIDWGQAIAGETRHYLDWFYGINLSRALMNAVKTTGKFKIMSIGRVQGPSLKLIVDKEKEIEKFESEPYWQVFITIEDGISKVGLELKHNKDLFDKDELKNFEGLKGKTAIAKTTDREQKLSPNPPFNLTSLQTEAYKFYGLKPARTLQIAQGLYLAGLISYPRTSSQKLPKEVGYDKILKQLAKKFKAEKLIKNKTPIEGKKTDPAHPSIYPTGQEQVLSEDDKKIYNLIATRFLSLFCEDAIINARNVTAEVDGNKFMTSGKVIKKKAWLEIYPSKLKEEKIPEVNGEKKILDSRTEEKETQPPRRFSPASIISELEKRKLGTKATRSSIIETLYDRGYIQGDSITATPLGISLIDTLDKYSPIIIDEKLTEEFETGMQDIQEEKKREEQLKFEDKIIESAKDTITNISKDFEKHEKKIGSELVDANVKHREQQKIENQLITCPKCNKGHLSITYSKKNRRFFVACNAYPDCQNTFSLPPNGIIKKTEKVCEECGYPMLMRLSKGKRPWIFCWNPKCPTNAEWVKKRDEKVGEEGKE
jgi:DNA topoisomerase I